MVIKLCQQPEGLGLWMISESRDRFERAAKAGVMALPALIAALLLAMSSPAEARHFHHAIGYGPTDPAKDAALIVDGETGKVLYARNAEAERHPASLTKMMTLYLLFDALKKRQMTLETQLVFSSHAASQKPTNMRVGAGETIDADTAIRAIVVRSANDVAVAVAEALGGTEAHFAELMAANPRAASTRSQAPMDASTKSHAAAPALSAAMPHTPW